MGLAVAAHDSPVADYVFDSLFSCEDSLSEPLCEFVGVEAASWIMRKIARRDDPTALAGIVV